jgi:hypothetical protein
MRLTFGAPSFLVSALVSVLVAGGDPDFEMLGGGLPACVL